jgi:putative Ca2+/H+ antiporter (TMEM165/GDT1 family)
MVLAVNVVNSGLVALVLASYMEQTRWWVFFGMVVALTVARAIGWHLNPWVFWFLLICALASSGFRAGLVKRASIR